MIVEAVMADQRFLVSCWQINTARFESVACGINHSEGGWPKDVSAQDLEQTGRFRKKVEKDEGYVGSVLQLCRVRLAAAGVRSCPPPGPDPSALASAVQPLDYYARQNNALNIYQGYFEEEDEDEEEAAEGGQETLSARTVGVLR